jgi:D-aminopeptidase
VLSYLKGVERTASHMIRYRAADMLEAADFMLIVTTYNPNLEP